MRRRFILALVLLLVGGIAYGAMTYDQLYYRNNRGQLGSATSNDPLYNLWGTLEGLYEGTANFDAVRIIESTGATYWTKFQGGDQSGNVTYTLPTADGGAGTQLTTNGSGVLSWAAAGGSFTGGDVTGDIHMANGIKILSETAAGNSSAIEAMDDDGGPVRRNVLSWTNGNTPAVVLGAAQDSVAITSTGLNVTTAGAVSGVSTLAMTGALSGVTTVTASGAISGTTGTFSAGVILDSAGTITNSSDSEFRFLDAAEDIIFDLDAAANVVGLKSTTGVNGLAMGDVDDLSGVGSIAFDAAASTVTLTSTGDAQDLTISVAGANNSSLIMNSAGTAADALQIATSAGGIDITVAGAAANEDLDLTANSSINILAREDAASTIVIATTGGGGTSETIDITNDQGTAEDALDIDATAGGIDIDFATGKNMAITGGQFIVTSNEDVASAINLVTNTGTSETIVVTNTQGTGEGGITLTSTAGGIDLNAAATKNIALDGGQILLTSTENAASAIALTANAGANETIVLTNTQGTGEGALTLTATAGGIDLNAATGKNVDVLGGQFIVLSNEDVANAIYLRTNTGTSETINVLNSQGTAAGSIAVTSTAGGIDIDAAATKILDIDAGTVQIDTKTAGAGAIALTANQGAADTITVTNTQGNTAGAVTVTATAGGITLAAAAGGVTLTSDVYVKKGGDIASPAGGELDLTNGVYFDITGTNNITSIAAADSIAGRLIVLQFDAILTFTDGGNLKLAGNFVTSADDTITLICDGTNWHEVARSVN